MEITDINSYLNYYSKIKSRTERLFEYIPPDKVEWTYHADKFTIGDIIRHIALIERMMYAETIQMKPSLYKGCGIEFAKGYKDIVRLYKNMQMETTEILARHSNNDLNKKCATPAGIKLTIWKWLRAMIEHEVHHRGQI